MGEQGRVSVPHVVKTLSHVCSGTGLSAGSPALPFWRGTPGPAEDRGLHAAPTRQRQVREADQAGSSARFLRERLPRETRVSSRPVRVRGPVPPAGEQGGDGSEGSEGGENVRGATYDIRRRGGARAQGPNPPQ